METLGGGLQVQTRLVQAGLWPWQWVARRTSTGAKPSRRGPRKTPGNKYLQHGQRKHLCRERFLMKYGLLTVQEGRGRAVWEAAYRSTAVQTHSSSAVTDPRWFYCPYILRIVLKSAAHGSEIWDRWIRTAGRGLEGFIGRALVSVTPVNGHHMLAVICASCWICIGCMMWINDFL